MLAAVESGDSVRVSEAVTVAEGEARRLAGIVARRLVDPLELAAQVCRVCRLSDAQVDALGGCSTVAEIVAWMRGEGLTLDDGAQGARDGWVITAREAHAYASCRSLHWDAFPWVTVPLLAGEVA